MKFEFLMEFFNINQLPEVPTDFRRNLETLSQSQIIMVETTQKSPTQLEKHITGVCIVITGIFGRSFYQSILFQPR